MVEVRRAGDDELRVRDVTANQLRRRGEIRQNARNLVRTAARENRDGRRGGREPQAGEKPLARRRRFREIDQRMPDEFDRHAAGLVNRRLERKNDEHAIRDGADRGEPPRPRRPDLGADVVDDRNAEALDRRSEAEIEAGKVDQDERIGPIGLRRRDEPPPCGQQPRQLGNPLGEAGDRDLAVVGDEAAAGRRELRAAEARDAQRGIDREELAGQRPGVQIAGCLTAGQEEARAQDAGRVKSAGGSGALIFTSVTRRSTDTGPTFCVARKANWMPSTAR